MNLTTAAFRHSRLVAGIAFLLLGAGCDGDDARKVELFEQGELIATASTTAATAGDLVTFTDNSTKAYTRQWSFPGGEPVAATAETVNVSYAAGGSYVATLVVTFVDNTTQTREFALEIEGLPDTGGGDPVIDGATYGVFTEHANITQGKEVWFLNANAFVNKPYDGDAFEGTRAQSFIVDGTGAGDPTWAMGIVQHKDGSRVDLSQFVNGYLNMAIKSTSTGALRIRIRGTGLDASKHLTSEGAEYGFARDGSWYQISIPMADILAAIPEGDRAAALTQVQDLLILRSGDGLNITTVDNYNFDIDDVYYSENLPEY